MFSSSFYPQRKINVHESSLVSLAKVSILDTKFLSGKNNGSAIESIPWEDENAKEEGQSKKEISWGVKGKKDRCLSIALIVTNSQKFTKDPKQLKKKVRSKDGGKKRRKDKRQRNINARKERKLLLSPWYCMSLVSTSWSHSLFPSVLSLLIPCYFLSSFPVPQQGGQNSCPLSNNFFVLFLFPDLFVRTLLPADTKLHVVMKVWLKSRIRSTSSPLTP